MTSDALKPFSSSAGRSASKDWLRALQFTAGVEKDHSRTLPIVFDAIAKERGDATALISDHERYSFRQLSERSLRYALWAQARGLRKGDVVALVMENRAEYVATWLGLTRIGVVVALINVNLAGAALAHCLNAASARIVIASTRYSKGCEEALRTTRPGTQVLVYDDTFRDELMSQSPTAPCLDAASRPILSDHALYIYTSGTTGMPKAAIVSHRRVLHWAWWFCGLVDVTPADRMYDCLPLYHSVGGVVAIWATLLGGGSVLLRERFSVSAFWNEIVEGECTLFQYIGELCRYLARAPSCEAEKAHRLRLVLGNGLRPEVWPVFERRFKIPRILEFYAATESNFSLYNVEGEPGAIGRVPGFLSARHPLRLVKFDIDSDAPYRAEDGFCQLCAMNEAGEAIARVSNDFDGYLDHDASQKKILRDAFEVGDAWMRSGDLMRKDARGFYHFVDRVGDTFRWKGENVASVEVAQAIASYLGVVDVTVYGVEVPGRDGRAGMAALVVEESFDVGSLRAHLHSLLPSYARPVFLRLTTNLDVTDTFKHKKRDLAAQGFDPSAIGEPLYFSAPGQNCYATLDLSLYHGILSGSVAM